MQKIKIPARCGNCEHWKRYDETGPDHIQGECKRYPPDVIASAEGVAAIAWPATDSTDYCGEFALRVDS